MMKDGYSRAATILSRSQCIVSIQGQLLNEVTCLAEEIYVHCSNSFVMVHLHALHVYIYIYTCDSM